MKSLKRLIFIVPLLWVLFFCSAQDESNIKVYYFHFTRRCATCQAIEDVSRKAVQDFYQSKVIFEDYNLEEEKGKEIAEKNNISSQALVIIHGEEIINITNEGFLYARNNPDKLKQIIKEKIDPLLSQ